MIGRLPVSALSFPTTQNSTSTDSSSSTQQRILFLIAELLYDLDISIIRKNINTQFSYPGDSTAIHLFLLLRSDLTTTIYSSEKTREINAYSENITLLTEHLHIFNSIFPQDIVQNDPESLQLPIKHRPLLFIPQCKNGRLFQRYIDTLDKLHTALDDLEPTLFLFRQKIVRVRDIISSAPTSATFIKTKQFFSRILTIANTLLPPLLELPPEIFTILNSDELFNAFFDAHSAQDNLFQESPIELSPQLMESWHSYCATNCTSEPEQKTRKSKNREKDLEIRTGIHREGDNKKKRKA